jgi:hypothetical protein
MKKHRNGFLNTLKIALRTAAPIAMLHLCLPSAAQAQEVKAETEDPAPPIAVTLAIHGKCDYSADGVTFTKLEKSHDFEQGAFVRTSEGARVDLFFRRTGTAVRLQPGSEMKIEKMTSSMKDGLPTEYTLLDLRAGRIFVVVRSKLEGSTFEIKNQAGRALVEGSGVGRYIITADGTHVAAHGSAIPLKVVGDNGITVIAAGQQFARKDGKMLPAKASEWVKDLIEVDELQSVMEESTAKETPPKP